MLSHAPAAKNKQKIFLKLKTFLCFYFLNVQKRINEFDVQSIIVELHEKQTDQNLRCRFWKNTFYTGTYKSVSIQSFLLSPPANKSIHYKNKNKRDNRKENLYIN